MYMHMDMEFIYIVEESIKVSLINESVIQNKVFTLCCKQYLIV